MTSYRLRTLTFTFMAAIGLASAAGAQDKPVKVANAWVRLPADGATSTIAVAAVENPGMYTIYMLSATSDAAGKVEFRDASKGPQAIDEVAVINYETTYLDPKGIHLFLSDLKRPLKEGDTVTIQIKTDQGTFEVPAVVKKE
jgi:copper(I)-binding protein